MHWKGDAQFELDPATIVGLLNDLYALDFFLRRDQYTTRQSLRLSPDGKLTRGLVTVSDLPGLILTVRILDYTKTIEMNSMFGPTELLAFGAKVDSLTSSWQWVKGPSR